MASMSVILCENIERVRYLHGGMISRRTKHCRQYTQSAAIRRLTYTTDHVDWQLAVSVDLITKWTVHTTLCLTATYSIHHAVLMLIVRHIYHAEGIIWGIITSSDTKLLAMHLSCTIFTIQCIIYPTPLGMQPSHWVCKPACLVPVPSQDKLGGLCQERHTV